MRSLKRKNRSEPESSVRDDRASQDDILAVIADIDSGHEYYMAFVDEFKFDGNEYVVMYNYEPDDGQHADPELIIMRSQRHVDGEQYFLSIKNRKELDAAFNIFFQRFEESGGI